jgi:pyruvate dehydrogenase E2 component (dihydrolipoamide acetyltransferase)
VAQRVPRLPAGVRASPVARVLADRQGVDLATLSGTGPGGVITLADVERALREAARVQTPAPAPLLHRVSPVAQRMAEELGLDVATLRGSGEREVVTKADVERAAAVGATITADRSAAMRQAIAAAMTRSWREIPHYHLATDVDLSRAVRWLEAENLKRPVTERILSAALLLKAVALALRELPDFNGFWVDDGFHPGAGIHVGVAISLRGGGLVAPAIHDVDTRPLDDLMRSLRDVVNRARGGMLRGSELTDPTITVTNLGDQGVREVFGVISPPQVALVGIGKIVERAWAEGGMLAVRPVVTLTLAADHRASDGHRGARFLSAVDRLLQTPEGL